MSTAGAIRAARAYVTLGMDESEFDAAARNLKRRIETLGQELTRAGMFIGGVGASLGAMFVPAIKAAAHYQETLNRFQMVFKELTPDADAFAKSLSKGIGRSAVQIQDYMSSFQQFFVGLGFGTAESLKFTKQMTQAAFDMASFNDTTDEEMLQRFLQGLSGSGEVFAKFGVNIKESAINMELLNAGLQGGVRAASEEAKAIARMAIILKTMSRSGAAGDAERTLGSFTNQAKNLRANLHDLAVTIGTALIPPLTKMMAIINPVLDAIDMWVKENPGFVVALAALSAGLVVTGAAMTVLGIVMTNTVAVFSLFTRFVKFLAYGGLARLVSSLYTVAKAMKAVSAASLAFMVATPWAAALVALTAIVAGIGGVIALTNKFAGKAQEATRNLDGPQTTRYFPISQRTHDEWGRPVPMEQRSMSEIIAQELGMRPAEDPDAQMREQDPEKYAKEMDKVIGPLGDSFASFSGVEASRRVGRAQAAERTADASEKTAKNTELIAKLLQNAGPLVFAGN